MVKIGRNDRCHCGSGKKYKKCCLDKDTQLTATKTLRKPFDHLLSYEEVHDYSTDEIIQKLRQMGIPFEEEVFLADIEKFYSAQELSEHWFNQYPVQATGREEDFPWFAAWILWERLAPTDNLSMEQISNLMHKGAAYLDENDPVSACNTWLRAWEAIKYRINPEFQSLDYLDEHYRGSFYVSNFCQDLETELYHAGLRDPAYFEKRIDYCREFCTFFPKESELIIHNMRRAIAESYGKLDQYSNADSEFERLVQDYPDNPWGYIGWGDMYFDDKEDYNKAKVFYEKALAIAKDKWDIEAIKERLDELRRK